MAGAAGSPACALAAPGSGRGRIVGMPGPGPDRARGSDRRDGAGRPAADAEGRRCACAKGRRYHCAEHSSPRTRRTGSRIPDYRTSAFWTARAAPSPLSRIPSGRCRKPIPAMPHHAPAPPGADGDSDRPPFHPADARAGAARRHAMAGYCAGASCAACTSASAAASCGWASISGSDSASVSHSPPASACSSSSTIASLPSSGATCKVL